MNSITLLEQLQDHQLISLCPLVFTQSLLLRMCTERESIGNEFVQLNNGTRFRVPMAFRNILMNHWFPDREVRVCQTPRGSHWASHWLKVSLQCFQGWEILQLFLDLNKIVALIASEPRNTNIVSSLHIVQSIDCEDMWVLARCQSVKTVYCEKCRLNASGYVVSGREEANAHLFKVSSRIQEAVGDLPLCKYCHL